MKRKFTSNLVWIPALILLMLATTGYAYSHWGNRVKISGTVKTACWTGCISIWKTIDGPYTNPYTGEALNVPYEENGSRIVAVANETFFTRFKLTIYVKNCGGSVLSDVMVYDTIGNNVGPIENEWTGSGVISWDPTWDDWDGESFQKNKLTWYIGSLDPDETVSLVIWLKTLKNPAGKYEPTSESQDLEIQLSDKGAKVVAEALCGKLTAVTEPIILAIEDIEPGVENAVAVIGTELPYSTPHAEDSCP